MVRPGALLRVRDMGDQISIPLGVRANATKGPGIAITSKAGLHWYVNGSGSRVRMCSLLRIGWIRLVDAVKRVRILVSRVAYLIGVC
jgi:hypothetical protein